MEISVIKGEQLRLKIFSFPEDSYLPYIHMKSYTKLVHYKCI